MHNSKSFLAGNSNTMRTVAQLGAFGGFLLLLVAIALVVNFWNARNTYTKITATVTNMAVSPDDNTVWMLTYAYSVGTQQVMDNTYCPEEMAKDLKVGSTFLLLRDPDTGEIAFAHNEKYIQALSLKLGIAGLVVMIAATVLLRLYPKQ